ncbi:thioredoxin-disulfide reductase [Candidatus Magnetoovum chiemensis]|nr:thioredoxin-disulfide reductase [Candidatus Magnetoovum chiemensis]
MDNLYDVIIIGGGPAGLSAAQYSARLNLKCIVLDKSATAGALAFTSKIENYPGILEPLTGKELLDIFRKQAVDFGAEYKESQVIGVKIEADSKEVYTMDNVYKTKTLIIATGAMGRKASIKGEAELLGKGVSYCAICDAAFYRKKPVCVIGDSEEAIKEADLLTRFTDKVTLITSSSKLADEHHPSIVDKKINVLLHTKVLEIIGNEVVEKIRLENRDTKQILELDMEGVFVYLHGNRPIVDFLNFVVDISDEECIMTNRMMETNIDGVYSAGDVSCTEVRQVVIAAANGCVAALSAEKYINHRKRRKLDWS